MRFHLPSFLYHFDQIVPYDVPYCQYNYRVFLSPSRPLKTVFLQDLVSHALLSSLRDPQGTPTETERVSLFATPTGTYLDALHDALHETQTYLARIAREQESGGGGKVRYDYRIDLRVVACLLRRIRLEEDVHLLKHVIRSCEVVSLRLLRELCKTRYGVVLSDRRLTPALKVLEKQGLVKRGTEFSHVGRDVVSESKTRFAWLRR